MVIDCPGNTNVSTLFAPNHSCIIVATRVLFLCLAKVLFHIIKSRALHAHQDPTHCPFRPVYCKKTGSCRTRAGNSDKLSDTGRAKA